MVGGWGDWFLLKIPGIYTTETTNLMINLIICEHCKSQIAGSYCVSLEINMF